MTRKTEVKDDKNHKKLALVMECLLSCAFSEDEEVALIRIGKAACADPNWMDYVYRPDRHGLDGTVDAAVQKAFSYRPIILGVPPKGPAS
jgi:hypothetical protein